jgi:hypothetical protein
MLEIFLYVLTETVLFNHTPNFTHIVFTELKKNQAIKKYTLSQQAYNKSIHR